MKGNSVSGADWLWITTRIAIVLRDDERCIACGAEEDLSIDHVRPRCRGGSNRPSNLVTMCVSCNASRGARAFSRWRPELVAVVRRHVRRKLDREAALAVVRELRPNRLDASRERSRRVRGRKAAA